MKGLILGLFMFFTSMTGHTQGGSDVPFPWGSEVPFSWPELAGAWHMEWENREYHLDFVVEEITNSEFPFSLYQVDLIQTELETHRVVSEGRGLVFSFQTTLDIVLTIDEKIFYTVTGAYVDPESAMQRRRGRGYRSQPSQPTGGHIQTLQFTPASPAIGHLGQHQQLAVESKAFGPSSRREGRQCNQHQSGQQLVNHQQSDERPQLEIYTSFFWYSEDGHERYEVPVRLRRID